MSHSDQPDSPNSNSEQSQRSLGETVDQANRAIEESRAEIARSQALRQSVADLAHELARMSEGGSPPSDAQEDEA